MAACLHDCMDGECSFRASKKVAEGHTFFSSPLDFIPDIDYSLNLMRRIFRFFVISMVKEDDNDE